MLEMNDNDKEMLPLVDAEGHVVGKASRGECHGGSMLLHPVVHLHLFDSNGRLWLQRRPQWKSIQPGKWDTAVGGHIDYGEKLWDALHRETREEIGLSSLAPVKIESYEFQSAVERELVNVFFAMSSQEPVPSKELDGGRFWTMKEIDDALGTGVFTPNFESEYKSIVRPKASDFITRKKKLGDIIVKAARFEILTPDLLYEMLRCRSEVFVVEQDCVYQDLDEADFCSWHFYIEVDGKIAAYLRLIDPGVRHESASIGRVLTVNEWRGCGLSRRLLEAAINQARGFGVGSIEIEAQAYLKEFYESLGFVATSGVFIYESRPHISMCLTL